MSRLFTWAPAATCCCFACTGAALPRRGFMVGAALLSSLPASAQSSLSPEAALAQLMDGNRRFAEQRMTSLNEDLDLIRRGTVAKQEPFAAVLACSDSRVPVELVFDQTIGRIFVARVAGNIASSDVIASLEYGAAVLGTRVVLVLGHANCGAVKAAIEGKAAPGQISALYRSIRPAIDQAGTDPTAVIRANAWLQARLLRDSSPVLGELVKQGKLAIRAGYYDLAAGRVALLEQ